MSRDLKDFQDGLYELYETLGSTRLYYYRLTPNSTPNIYGECLDKTYEEPIQLVGSIEPVTGSDRYNFLLDKLSTKDRGYLCVKVPYKCILDIGTTDPNELDKGRLEINSKMYEIVLVLMEDTFLGEYSICEFMCKEVL
jgi:hypothetical protein